MCLTGDLTCERVNVITQAIRSCPSHGHRDIVVTPQCIWAQSANRAGTTAQGQRHCFSPRAPRLRVQNARKQLQVVGRTAACPDGPIREVVDERGGDAVQPQKRPVIRRQGEPIGASDRGVEEAAVAPRELLRRGACAHTKLRRHTCCSCVRWGSCFDDKTSHTITRDPTVRNANWPDEVAALLTVIPRGGLLQTAEYDLPFSTPLRIVNLVWGSATQDGYAMTLTGGGAVICGSADMATDRTGRSLGLKAMLATTTVPVEEVVPEGLPSVKWASAWGPLPSIGRMQSPVGMKEYSCSSQDLPMAGQMRSGNP